MTATVVIPWRAGCEHRQAAFKWVKRQWHIHHPGWRIIVAQGNGGPWRKGELVRTGLELSASGVVVVADADCWTDGIDSAVRSLVVGAAEWAVPHDQVFRLTEGATRAVLHGAPWRGQLSSRPYTGRRGGGFVVAERDTLLDVPLDCRFEGWGQEDESWDLALTCLIGEPWRGSADLVHLWHPSPERVDRRKGSDESWRLMKKYMKARGDQEAMRTLIAGAI